jgi:hypothetical protein
MVMMRRYRVTPQRRGKEDRTRRPSGVSSPGSRGLVGTRSLVEMTPYGRQVLARLLKATSDLEGTWLRESRPRAKEHPHVRGLSNR